MPTLRAMTPSRRDTTLATPNAPDKHRSKAPEQRSKDEEGSVEKNIHGIMIKNIYVIPNEIEICHSGIFEPLKVLCNNRFFQKYPESSDYEELKSVSHRELTLTFSRYLLKAL